MKVGAKARVYHRSWDGHHQLYEGTATLIKPMRPSYGDGQEYWYIKFDGDKETYARWICPEDIIS